MRKYLFILFTALLAMESQSQQAAVNYLKVSGPINFNGESYSLVWSSHPSATYTKHEYLRKGEKVEQFNQMVMLEALANAPSIKSVAGAKVDELKKMKVSNPIVNWEIFENPKSGEVLLDFLISDPNQTIVEHNIYKYTKGKDANGKDAIVLFAVSERAYGAAIKPFLTRLKTQKVGLQDKVSKFQLPALVVPAS